MARNFYYGSDARVVAGSASFAALIGASAESFGLSVELAEQYGALDATLQEAFRAATTPATRTPVAVREKDEAMRAVQRRAAILTSVITHTRTVSDAQLLSLGLVPRPTRAARAVPPTPPTVEVVSVRGRVLKIRIHARFTDGKRMATNAVAAHVYTYVGEESPGDPRLYHFHGSATRATYEIVFPDDVPSGATAWVSAAWVSKRGKQGVACLPVRVTIQGGPVLPAAPTTNVTPYAKAA